MALKKKYAKQELIPEAQRGLYVEKNGEWVLDAEGDEGDDVKLREFRENNIRLQKQIDEEKKRAETLAKQFEGIDPEQFKKAQELMNRMAGDEERELIKQGKLDEVIQRRTAAAITTKNDELKAALKAREAAEAKAKVLSEKLGKQQIERQLQIELDGLGVKVKKGALDDVLARANRSWRIDDTGNAIAVDGEGKHIFGEDGQAIKMKEFANNLLVKTAPHLFEESRGGGAQGGERGEGDPSIGRIKAGSEVSTDQLTALAKGTATLV